MDDLEQLLAKLWSREEWTENELELLAHELNVNLDDDIVIARLFAEGWRWTHEDCLRRDV